MRKTISLLSESERETLYGFYESPYFKVVKKLIEIERLELAKDALETPEQAHEFHHQAKSLKRFYRTIRDAYKGKD